MMLPSVPVVFQKILGETHGRAEGVPYCLQKRLDAGEHIRRKVPECLAIEIRTILAMIALAASKTSWHIAFVIIAFFPRIDCTETYFLSLFIQI